MAIDANSYFTLGELERVVLMRSEDGGATWTAIEDIVSELANAIALALGGTVTPTSSYILLQTGDHMLLQTGDSVLRQ